MPFIPIMQQPHKSGSELFLNLSRACKVTIPENPCFQRLDATLKSKRVYGIKCREKQRGDDVTRHYFNRRARQISRNPLSGGQLDASGGAGRESLRKKGRV